MRFSATTSWPNWLILHLTIGHLTGVLAQNITPIGLSTTTAAVVSTSTSPTVLQSSISTSSSGPQTHTIQVGMLDHKMRPDTTEAAIGDTIEFGFYPLNHSIVRAEYGFPCIPYEMTGSGKTGFFSGFNPVDKVLDNPPKYSIRINDTEPIFFYCSAPGSCIKYGMVGGINLNSTTSIDKQRKLAMDSAYMLQPGEPFPAESPLPSGNPATSLPPGPSSSASSSASAASNPSSGGLSAGAIAGIVVAVFCAILFGAFLFFGWGRLRSLREAIERKDGTVRRVSASPNQMVEYKLPNVHTHAHYGHAGSPAEFQSLRSHPAVHPGSHPRGLDPGYGHQHDGNMGGTGYFPAPSAYTAKYPSPTAMHPAYHALSHGSPPLGSMVLNRHPFMHQHDSSPRGSPAPGYYETFLPEQSPRHTQVQELPVEMEAITAATLLPNDTDVNRASKS